MLYYQPFSPALIADLNEASRKVTGQLKYPVLHTSNSDTGERFGLQYHEPGCRPVPLDYDKRKTNKDTDRTGLPCCLLPDECDSAPAFTAISCPSCCVSVSDTT